MSFEHSLSPLSADHHSIRLVAVRYCEIDLCVAVANGLSTLSDQHMQRICLAKLGEAEDDGGFVAVLKLERPRLNRK